MIRSRRSDPTLLFALVTVLSYAGSVAAWIAHHNNQPRVAAYHADAACGTQLTPRDETAATTTARAGKSCTIQPAIASTRWIHTNRNSRYYRAAFTTPDGIADSVELKGNNRRAAWDALPPGTPLVVERFADPDPKVKPHVTAVRAAGASVPTGWNPDYRQRDANAGMLFLSLMTVGFGAGLVWSLRQRRIMREG